MNSLIWSLFAIVITIIICGLLAEEDGFPAHLLVWVDEETGLPPLLPGDKVSGDLFVDQYGWTTANVIIKDRATYLKRARIEYLRRIAIIRTKQRAQQPRT